MAENPIAAERTLPSDLAEVRRFQNEVKDALEASRYGERDMFHIELAIEEALVNAIKHGNQLDPTKVVRVTYVVTEVAFEIRIEDEGTGFDPREVPDPTLPENMGQVCGRGIHLIKNFMTSVEYVGRGNVVTMSKLRNGTPE
jgi:serine/threonine-protein kinase RsbW